jgi:predicted transcriptional regulator
MIIPAQCRAARGWLDMTQAELAKMVGCSPNVVIDFEGSRRASTPAYVMAIQHVLEGRGIVFLAQYEAGLHISSRGIAGPDAPQTRR